MPLPRFSPVSSPRTTLREGGSARQLMIARNDDGEVIGTALLFKYDEGSQRVELGYVLGRSHWRQGYASEALGT